MIPSKIISKILSKATPDIPVKVSSVISFYFLRGMPPGSDLRGCPENFTKIGIRDKIFFITYVRPWFGFNVRNVVLPS